MSLTPETMCAMRVALYKRAGVESTHEDASGQQQEAPAPKPPHPMLTAAKRLGVYGVGTGAGMLAGHLAHRGADALHQKFNGSPLPVRGLHGALPLLGGAAALAFQLAQNDAFQKIREDGKARRQHVRETS